MQHIIRPDKGNLIVTLPNNQQDKELQDLKTKLNDSEKRTAEILNEHEQYSRRETICEYGFYKEDGRLSVLNSVDLNGCRSL
ncbi:hypothetical protein DPMN_193445 [Dreissena polymorpha]|uniref:Uncharacterized protein n=1 Tax=Dreissena polymorpha TaxID=45954 RepID=A0A9D3Y160_DREPO|nr:hypothetical protein DPMN_193445 [Dreissena polymorpha]